MLFIIFEDFTHTEVSFNELIKIGKTNKNKKSSGDEQKGKKGVLEIPWR